MRHLSALLVPLVALGATAGAAVPAGAGQPDRTDYTVAECPAENVSFDMWFSGPVAHISAENTYDLFVLESGTWRHFGQNTTYPFGTSLITPGGREVAAFRGAFSLRDDGTIGDFDGRWSWGMSELGRAVARSTDGSALLKLALYEGAAPYEEVTGAPMPDSPDEMCGVTTYHVMAK
jgi:hypothetical protein